MLERPLPARLVSLLREHRAAHAPRYPPSEHTDHGPMACLALHGLGFDPPDIERFAAAYRRRLVALPEPALTLHPDDWHEHLGLAASYPSLLEFFDAQIYARGFQATLARYLPSLISGWVRDLFHPLIRLGYGIEFELPSEIAAGLAYLASSGNDPRLALAARLPPADTSGVAYLALLRPGEPAPDLTGPAPFNRRYRRVMLTAELRPAAGQPDVAYRELGHACLEIFAATSDFFALHLLTATHAFRVCSPWAGPHAAGVFSVGISAAYLAIGAPASRPLERADAAFALDRLAAEGDEHDIKLAYSCKTLGKELADPRYEEVAHRYLDARLPKRG